MLGGGGGKAVTFVEADVDLIHVYCSAPCLDHHGAIGIERPTVRVRTVSSRKGPTQTEKTISWNKCACVTTLLLA